MDADRCRDDGGRDDWMGSANFFAPLADLDLRADQRNRRPDPAATLRRQP